MRRDVPRDAPFKEWTVDKKAVMQAVELAAGLDASRSFIQQQSDTLRQGGLQEPPSR